MRGAPAEDPSPPAPASGLELGWPSLPAVALHPARTARRMKGPNARPRRVGVMEQLVPDNQQGLARTCTFLLTDGDGVHSEIAAPTAKPRTRPHRARARLTRCNHQS